MILNKQSNFNKVGIIGLPISHSLSPLIHNYWLKLYNINTKYVSFEVKENEIKKFIKKVKTENFRGFNVTIPYKEKIISYLDDIDVEAKKIGAVNTVIISSSGRLLGKNTDGYGFLENLRSCEKNFAFSSSPVLILGAGGAARSISFALKSKGCKNIRILSRRLSQAQGLSRDLGNCSKSYDFKYQKKALLNISLFVNTTPMGMKNFPWQGIDLSNIPKESLVYDIVYKPRNTHLIKFAKANGNKYIEGIGMLLYQAIPCFEWWFGQKPTVDENLEKIISVKL